MVIQNVEKTDPVDDAFDALRQKHQRRILYSLIDQEPYCELFVEDLMHSGKDRERQRVTLFHNHLPKLNELGYIEWERGSCTICRGPQFDKIAPYIRIVKDNMDELPSDWS